MDDDLLLLVRTQQLVAIHLVCLVVSFITHHRLRKRNHVTLPTRDMMLNRQRVRKEMMSNLSTSGKCRELIRMSEKAFMIELFAKDRATGGAAETAKERRNRMNNNERRVDLLDEVDRLLSTNDISLENLSSGDSVEATFSMPPSQTKPPTVKIISKSKKRKVEEEDAFISKITSSMDNVVAAIMESTKVLERSRPRVYSEEEIYNELELMGVGPDVISRAYLFLVEKPEKARALFGCPLPMRLSILRQMMDASY